MTIADQTGRIAVVTGGASGIGRAAATALAAKGAHVVLASRNRDQGRAAAADIPGDVEYRPLDLAALDSIHEFARTIDAPIDLLFNNAGAMSATLRHTADGFETQFGVNHLGHFVLTNLLADRLSGRVITTTSSLHRKAHINFGDLQWEHRAYQPFAAYGESKLANLLFTAELQRRLIATGSEVIACAADPGWVASGFQLASGSRLRDSAAATATKLLAQHPKAGSKTILFVATANVLGNTFAAPRFGMRGKPVISERSQEASDPRVALRLWQVSEQLTGVRSLLS